METNKLLLLGGLGIAAYLLMTTQARAAQAQQYRVPGQTATGAPRYPTAPSVVGATEAAAYRDLGSLIGGIYRRIGGSSAASSGPITAPALPDDSVAGNPPGSVDPYTYELATWGQSLGDYTFQ